jgi:hypothetical protein
MAGVIRSLNITPQSKAVSPLRSATALQNLAVRRRAGFPACWFTGLSCPVFNGNWKVA